MPAGRPTDFREEYIEQAYKLALLGLTDVQMAEVFGVVEATFNNWKTKHPEFLVSVNKGKVIADAEVASSFHKRAVGYTYGEETYEGGKLTRTVVKEMAPDSGAALNWLKNRQPDRWRDKHDFDHTSDGKPIVPVVNVYNQAPPLASSESEVDE